MAHSFEDIVIFHEGALNWDDDKLVMPVADARIRQNVILSDEGNYNILVNVLGNLQKNDPDEFDYPSGLNKVQGFTENKEEQAGIFALWDADGEHSIIQYNSMTDELTYILRGGTGGTPPPYKIGDILNFQRLVYIDMGLIGNEEDKYLVWTDGVNEPRMINIDLAIKYTNGLTGGYPSIDENTLRLYKKPYLGFLNVSYVDVPNVVNNLRGWLWQFAIRLKFIDKTYSVLSPFSPIAVPSGDEYINGIVVEEDTNNRIQIQIDDLGDDMVDAYQLCFRKIDVDGSPSNWYLSNTKFIDTGGSFYANFSGENDSILLSQDYSSKLQDWVPDLADHVGIIDSNRIVLGDVTEGYDNLPYESGTGIDPDEIFDVELDLVTPTIPTFYQNDDIATNTASPDTLIIDYVANSKFYKFQVVSSISPFKKAYSYYNPDGTISKNTIATFISTSINNDFTGANTSVDLITDDLVIGGHATNVTTVLRVTTNENFSVPVFKTNATHVFGIIYIYGGKYGAVQKNESTDPTTHPTDGCVINIPADTSGVWNSANTVEATINHIAPVGATHYQWAYLGSDIDYFEEYFIEIESDSVGNIIDNEFLVVDGDYLKINKTNLINYNRGAYSDAIEYGFDFAKGDIVHFKSDFGFNAATDKPVLGGSQFASTSLLQATILEVDVDSITIKNILANTTFGFTQYPVIEIYRRKDLLTGGTFQAIPGVYEIDTATRYHSGNVQDQTAVLPAVVSFEGFGDCFYTNRVFINDLNSENLHYDDLYTNGTYYLFNGLSEQKNFSLMYDSQLTYFGKVNAYNEFAQRGKFRKIRWGGKFFDDAGVNFISAFDYDDERILDDRNGETNKIQQIGDTLKVYQERKVNSFYLKTTSSTNADGSQTYVFDGSVMSDIRQSVMDYGCTHFTSYVKTVRTAYFFDEINATVIKDTPGGLIPIGDIKMKSYFRAKIRAIKSYEDSTGDPVEVYGGYDEYLKMYLLTFATPDDPGNALEETIGFYEGLDRWLAFYSYIPEYYGKISGDTAIAFYEGKLYMQNKSSIRNHFFGIQYESIVDVFAKGNPAAIKVYDSIEIHANDFWAPDEDADIEITIPTLMQSKLPEGHFEIQEGVYFSEFLRDMLDGGSTPTRTNLHEGRQLRGSVIRVRLRNDSLTESRIRLVKINSTISR